MDNNKPITETDKDIQSVSKSDLLIDQFHFEICKDPMFVVKLKHFTSVFVAFRFFPAITCDFKSTVPMMTSGYRGKRFPTIFEASE
ncbi:hypothetical protein T07_727 [Trichinella nelsoni]|uniref:Uncharacterized protein n=1 Tax=Trichinella nelsoni TaxID=6336 RepID=A0A0V0RKX7_9BILA|nr:hypothetical protein T07_727 [Trichinella nelsoni]